MKRLRTISYGLGVLIPALLLAISTFGAEEGGNAAEQPIGMMFRWLHFAIVATLAYWFFGRILPPFFRRQADNISRAIEKGAAAKADAEKRLKEAAEKMANLEREVAAFRAQAHSEASAEMERLRGTTELDLEKIRVAARAEIAAAERAARVELKELAAKLAVDGAETLVTQQMTPAVQEAMINSFVKSLQGRPN